VSQNDETALPDRSATSTLIRIVAEPDDGELERLGRSVLVGIIGIRETIAAGVRYSDGSLPADVVAEVDAGLAGIERDLDLELNPAAGAGRFKCRSCPADFRWPGERDAHELRHLEAAA
jgi:hypothetical protein